MATSPLEQERPQLGLTSVANAAASIPRGRLVFVTMTPAPHAAVLKREDTPTWLRGFTKKLYGNECLICHERRLLEVAHLLNWEGVKDELDRINVLREYQVFGPDGAFWIFHQPVNVVLLCRWCHGLYDAGDR
jgi:hypothetical protein